MDRQSHIGTGMGVVLLGLDVDPIACAASVLYEDHSQRVDVEFSEATVQMFGLAFLIVISGVAE